MQKNCPTIGLLIPRLEESYQARVWPGVVDYAQEHNTNLILFVGKPPQSPYGYDYQHNTVYNIVNKRYIDGLVLVSGNLGNFLTTKELEKFLKQFRPIPMVSIALEISNIPSVLVDNESGIRQGITHLIKDHGFRRIAFIRGTETHQEAERRFATFIKVLEEYGIPFDKELTVSGDLVPSTGFNAIKILIDEKQASFDAIVAANDGIALGAIKALQARGIRVPHDIAVIGFDDIDEATYITPPLTTVKQPLYEQAKTAIKILLDMIEGSTVPDSISLPTTLVIRESCGCFPDSIANEVLTRKHKKKKYKTLEEALSKMRSSILNTIVTTIEISQIEKERFTVWIKQLIDNLVIDLRSGTGSDSFTRCLNEILIQKTMNRTQFNMWLDILEKMRVNISSFLKDFRRESLIQLIFHQAWTRVREIMMRSLYYKRIQFEYDFGLLGEVSQALITTIDMKELMNAIASEFPKIGIDSSYIVLYKQNDADVSEVKWKLPATSELMLAFNRERRMILGVPNKTFRTATLLPGRLLRIGTRRTLICMSLFFRDDQFGYILFELGPREEIIYETLRSQISSAIKSALLFQKHLETEEELKKILDQLERTNKELQSLSLRDELTGLYNRRAFLTLGEQYMKLAQRTGRIFLLFFADMDGLKKINDTFGHREGDGSIIKAAEILRKSFRQADIIARFGGDEFTIIAIDATQEDVIKLTNNLQNNILSYNRTSKKPYKLAISMGYSVFRADVDADFEKLIYEADTNLYEHKRMKKN
ncbi:MAG: GGDEF domain-containing protein [Spirochaetales bacterium]|nr:GGDEF domain-containing protein [Spirochaetales bacterium]